MTTTEDILKAFSELSCVVYTGLTSRGPHYPCSDASSNIEEDGWCVEFLATRGETHDFETCVELPSAVLQVCAENDWTVRWNMDSEVWEVALSRDTAEM